MSTAAEYIWDIRRTFVDKRLRFPIVRKSGEVVTTVKVPVTIYRLLLTGDFIATRSFRCAPVVRSGKISWSVSALTEQEKPLWPMPALRPDPKADPVWKKWASMTEAEFIAWLPRVLGPERALEELKEPKVASFFGHIYSIEDLQIAYSVLSQRSKKQQRRRVQPMPPDCVPNSLALEVKRRPLNSARGTASRSPPGAADRPATKTRQLE
jgi:hypothetical protein